MTMEADEKHLQARKKSEGQKLQVGSWTGLLPGGEEAPTELRVERSEHGLVGLQRCRAGLQDDDGATQRRHCQHWFLATDLK